jgi:hypothetical protein
MATLNTEITLYAYGGQRKSAIVQKLELLVCAGHPVPCHIDHFISIVHQTI